MQCTVLGNNLLTALQLVSKIPVKHPAQPVLAYTCITTTEKGAIEIMAHGIGVSSRVLIQAQDVSQPGRVVIDHNTLISFLSTLKNMSILELTVENGVLHIASGDSEADMKTFPHEAVSEFTPIQGSVWYQGSSQQFADTIKRVSFACAQSDIRPELASVYCSIKQGFLICAATDSFYLAEARSPSDSEDATMLLPNRYVPHVLHALSHSSQVEIIQGDGVAMLTLDNLALIIRTISGSYPQYEAIIPKDFPISIETTRDEVRNALRTIQPFTDVQFPKIMLRPDSESSACFCETEYNDKGRGKASFRARISGEAVDIRVNSDNILKILGVLSVDRIIFSCIDPMKPIMVTSPDDAYFRALLMPVGR